MSQIRIFQALSVLTSAFFLFSGCHSKPQTSREVPVTIRVRQPAVVDRPVIVRAGGNVEARQSVEIGFQIPGRIRRILCEEGQAVKAGELLAELDSKDYQFGADIASAEAAAARAVADKAMEGVRKQEMAQAKAAFEQADDEYRRMKVLYDRKSLAPNDFHKIEAQWKVARERYSEAQEGARRQDVVAAEAKARQAEANARLNEKRVADTRLLAPINGVVARRLNDPGEVVAAGMPVLSVMNLHPVRVRAGVPELEIAQIRPGQRALVHVPSLRGSEGFEGRVELVGYAAEAPSRTFAVRLLVPNPKLVLRAGMIAEAEIEAEGRHRALTVPSEAVVKDAQGAMLVWVYYDGKSRVFARRVQTGRATGSEVEITTGIAATDQIVVAGQHKLRDGALVHLEASR